MKKIIFVLIIGLLAFAFFKTDEFTFGGTVSPNFTATLFIVAITIALIAFLWLISGSVKNHTDKSKVVSFKE